MQNSFCSRQFAAATHYARTRIQFDSRVRVEAYKPRLRNIVRSSNRAGHRPCVGLTADTGFYLPTNRCQAGAWLLPQREITIKRLSNTPVGLKTGWVKNAMTRFLRNYHSCCESCPRKRTIGFGWLPVCREIPKTHTLVRKETTIQCTANP